jgi:hypothetical protein
VIYINTSASSTFPIGFVDAPVVGVIFEFLLELLLSMPYTKLARLPINGVFLGLRGRS